MRGPTSDRRVETARTCISELGVRSTGQLVPSVDHYYFGLAFLSVGMYV